MKKYLFIPLIFAMGSAHAAVLANENWNDGSGNAPGLTYTQGSTTIGEAGANKARDSAQYFVNTSSSQNSGTVYFSALAERIDTPAYTAADWGGLSFYAGGAEIAYFGSYPGSPSNREKWGIDGKGDGSNTSSIDYTSLTGVSFVVGMVDYDTNDVKLWINPAFGSSEPINADTAILGGWAKTDALTRLRLQANTSADMRFDEVKIGNTWGEVVPIPEPATGILAGLTGLLLAFRRRR